MVQYARFQRTIVDDAGNILAGAKVEVRSEATGALATLYADRNGASGLSNPVTADADGFAYFHVTGGAYKIRAYTGSSGSPTYEKIWRYEGIGRASETDDVDGVSAGTTRTLSLGGSPLDTTMDPGAGALTFNNAVIASVTEIAIDVLNLGGGNESDWLAALGSGTSTNKSRLEIRNTADPLVDFAIFDITASAVQGSPPTFYRLTVTHVASGGTLADAQTVNITSAPAGSKGDLGSDGTDPGILFNWDAGTSDADPGSGEIRADNASLASASFLYVSLTSRAGNDLTTFLANLDRSTNTVRLGEIILTRPSDDTQAIFDLDSVAADGSPATYYKLGVSNHSGATSFSAADAISFQFTADGNAGADGAGLVDSVNGYTGDVVVEAVDAGALAGLAVRAATTGVIDIATALNNGDTLDGVSLVTGDIVLVKDQAGGSPDIAYENGIYVVGAVPARHSRFSDYNPHCGAIVTVQEGTANADTIWQCTSNVGGTLDTTAIAFERACLKGANVQVFEANDTYIPTTGMKFCEVYNTGPGGGGGSGICTDADSANAGGGGSNGETRYKRYTADEIGANAAITMGLGGAGGSAGGSGSNGSGPTIFNPAGSGETLSSAAGLGGSGSSTAGYDANAGGAAATAGSGGTLLGASVGGGGGFGIPPLTGNNKALAGAGSASFWAAGGGAALGNGATTVNGADGYKGSGGAGGLEVNNNGNCFGGDGGDGFIFIREYL